MIQINFKNEKKTKEWFYKRLTVNQGEEWTLLNFLSRRKVTYKMKQRLVDFYQYLENNVDATKNPEGRSILTDPIHHLTGFIANTEKEYKNLLDKKLPGGKKTLRQDLQRVFYFHDHSKWGAYALAKKINVNVCPYCNRNYTFILGDDINKGTRFQFDHFYEKSKYPYLGLSLYNLIPSCNICNSNLKNVGFSIYKSIHPYSEGFNNILKFTILPKSVEFINGKSTQYSIGLKEDFNSNNLKKALRNARVFRLKDLYNMHKDYVDELIKKYHIYDDSYIEYLYQTYEGTLFDSKSEVKALIFSNYLEEKEFHRRPLSKLTADLIEELDTDRKNEANFIENFD